MARPLSLLCVAALAIAVAVTVSPTARASGGTQTFTDPAGDATGGAPDIETIVVSDDGADRFTVAATTPNRPTLNADDVIVLVFLTSDTTGVEVFYGGGATQVCAPIEPDDPTCAPIAVPVSAVFSGGTTTFTIDASTLDVADMVVVGVVTLEAVADGADHSDVGPLISYQLAPTTTTAAAPAEADTVAPHVKALAASGTHGKPVKLSYRSWDNSGTTREEIAVYRGSKRLWHTSTMYRTSSQTTLHTVTWKVPKSVRGKLRFSVEAIGAEDNASGVVWGKLTIR